MPKLHFIGRVLPPNCVITTPPGDIHWGPSSRGLEVDFKIRIHDSLINIEADSNRLDSIRDFSEINKQAFDLASAAVNLAAFAMGAGLTAMIDVVINPNGLPAWRHTVQPNLSQYCTAYSLNILNHNNIYPIVTTEFPLFWALNDLIECLRTTNIATINCARVIDNICRMVCSQDDEITTKDWENMRATLRISRGFLQPISDGSKKHRHANPILVSAEETNDILEKSWQVMNRYLEYRSRGSEPLDPSLFPVL